MSNKYTQKNFTQFDLEVLDLAFAIKEAIETYKKDGGRNNFVFSMEGAYVKERFEVTISFEENKYRIEVVDMITDPTVSIALWKNDSIASVGMLCQFSHNLLVRNAIKGYTLHNRS
jgi:hypothetical protein